LEKLQLSGIWVPLLPLMINGREKGGWVSFIGPVNSTLPSVTGTDCVTGHCVPRFRAGLSCRGIGRLWRQEEREKVAFIFLMPSLSAHCCCHPPCWLLPISKPSSSVKGLSPNLGAGASPGYCTNPHWFPQNLPSR
jgi:hypothetical protein